MMESKNISNLLEQLRKNNEWPLQYMFKFIAPNTDGKVEKVVNLLPTDSKITYKHTKNLRFVSVTCIASMPDAESIVDITTRACAISGVMSL